jgi:hypothetical protein
VVYQSAAPDVVEVDKDHCESRAEKVNHVNNGTPAATLSSNLAVPMDLGQTRSRV